MSSIFNDAYQTSFFAAEPALSSHITFPPVSAPVPMPSRLETPTGNAANPLETSLPVKSKAEGKTLPSPNSKITASESPADKKLRLAGSCLACVKGHRKCHGLPGQACEQCIKFNKVCSRDPNRRGAQEFALRGAQKLEQVLAREGKTIEGSLGEAQPSGVGKYVKPGKKGKVKELPVDDWEEEVPAETLHLDFSAPVDEIVKDTRFSEQVRTSEVQAGTAVSPGEAATPRPRKRLRKRASSPPEHMVPLVSTAQDPAQAVPAMPPPPVSAANDTTYSDPFRLNLLSFAPVAGAPLSPTSTFTNLLQTPNTFPLPLGLQLFVPQPVPNASVPAPQTPAGLQGTLCPPLDMSEIPGELTNGDLPRALRIGAVTQPEPEPAQSLPALVNMGHQQTASPYSTGDDYSFGDEYFNFDKFGSFNDLTPSSEEGSSSSPFAQYEQPPAWGVELEEQGEEHVDMDAMFAQMLQEYGETQGLTLLL